LQNLTAPPPYIASLQGDSARTLQVLQATGIGQQASTALLESAAIALLLVGGYVSWRIMRKYFSEVFLWLSSLRSSLASAFFVAGGAATVWFAYSSLGESVMITNSLAQVLFYMAFLIVFAFIVIPPPPSSSTRANDSGPSIVTFVFVILLFLEAQLVYYFVLPVTVPFP
jgi:hypothetical protein